MVLERNAGGFDAGAEVVLPRPLDLTPVDREQDLAYLLYKVK